ncbi:MAG: hypothetical protein Q9175_002956 [Cornicularia normoerica]
MDRLSLGPLIQEFKAPATFPFQRLPMELQLLMLQHILVFPAPIINPNVPLRTQKYLVKGEEKGRNQPNACMVFTCKLFYKEGLPLVYGHNTFMYTQSWTAFSFTLSKGALEECQRCFCYRSSSPFPIAEHPPGSPCNWNRAFQKHAANIYLRLPATDDFDFVKDCEEMLSIVDRFTNLRILRLDFLDVCKGYQYDWDEEDDLMHDLHSTVWNTMKKLQDPDRPAGALKEIVLTGLPQNDLSLYVVKQYTRLLAPSGRIGVGWGAKGKQYELLGAYREGEVTKREHLELLWMNLEGVEEWIVRKHQTKGSRWLFTTQTPERNVLLPEPEQSPEFKAWDQDYGGDLETLANLNDLSGPG